MAKWWKELSVKMVFSNRMHGRHQSLPEKTSRIFLPDRPACWNAFSGLGSICARAVVIIDKVSRRSAVRMRV